MTDFFKETDIPSKVFAWMSSSTEYTRTNEAFYVVREYVFVNCEEDIDKAINYLDHWIYFTNKKMRKSPIDECRIYRPPWLMKNILQPASIAVKLHYPTEFSIESSNNP